MAAVALFCVLPSCDNAIYDDEGDCSVKYRLKFLYNRNLKRADAFANEVKSVHVYAFDGNGILVWHKSDRGEALAADDYYMKLDLPAGNYHLVGWCGLENDGATEESFSVPEVRVGETRIEELRCSLNRMHDAEGAYSKERLHSLFHGMLDVTLPSNDDGGEYDYTMDLTKDTNHIRVILQHLSGKPVNEKNFTFTIETENGLMNYDNKLLSDEVINYRAYKIFPGIASIGIDDYPELNGAKVARQPSSREITSINVAIADLTIARLVKGKPCTLTIKTVDGRTAASIPLTRFALMLKDGYYDDLTDQDYLDYQDEYALTFFLSEDEEWPRTSIIINSWKIVLNDISFE